MKPGPLNIAMAARQHGKSSLIDQMISRYYMFQIPLWVVRSAQRNRDKKAWWKRFTG